jgi:hypothetical protein
MLVSLIKIFETLWVTPKWIFANPKKRVRKLDLSGESATYVYGTVDQVTRGWQKGCGQLDYWTVVWDDNGCTYVTYPAHQFIWHQGVHTLLTK